MVRPDRSGRMLYHLFGDYTGRTACVVRMRSLVRETYARLYSYGAFWFMEMFQKSLDPPLSV